jgi:plastocyanin
VVRRLDSWKTDRSVRRLAVSLAALLAWVASGCGGGDATSPVDVRPSGKATVVITDGAYIPARVRIRVGERVTWINRDEAPNTVESGGAGFFEVDRDKLDARNVFDLHTFQQGEAESLEFDTPGAYKYHSSLNGDMEGVVEVVEKDG